MNDKFNWINGDLAKTQLTKLAQNIHYERRYPSIPLESAFYTAIFIGAVSSEVFYEPTQRATADYSRAFRNYATLSTILTNAIVNVYFNILALESLHRIKDPITGQLTISPWILAIDVGVSVMSAFCVAFLVIDINKITLPALINFFFQLINYSAQHYMGVVDFSEFLIGKIKNIFNWLRRFDSREEIKAAGLKNIILSRFESTLHNLNKNFYHYPQSVNEFYVGEQLDTSKLIDEVYSTADNLVEEGACTGLGYLAYLMLQFTGIGTQLIANLGYYNATINGFSILKNSLGAWALASGSVTPFYILSFVLSCENIDKITSTLFKIYAVVKQRRFRHLLDEIPFSIRRTPKFSFFSGGTLMALAAFSPFTALVLTSESLYGGNDQNPSQFNWIDPDQQYKNFFLGTTLAAAIFFNMFPVPDVQQALSTRFCLKFGSPADRRAIETLEILQSTKKRVSKIPEKAFGSITAEPDLKSQPVGVYQARRENPCTRLAQWLFSRRGPCHREPQSDLSQPLFNGGNIN